MRNITVALCLSLTTGAWALTTVEGRIQQIDKGEPHLLFMSSGEVVKVTQDEDLAAYEEAMKRDEWLAVRVNAAREAEASSLLPPPPPVEAEGPSAFEPTVLGADRARSIFNHLNAGYRSWSQCYNRAHVWAWETKQDHDVNTMKVFLFFTARYIREYDFMWWFHVAPYAHVSEDNKTVEKVLDYYFLDSPVGMKDWTDEFMDNHATCPVVSTYSQYEEHQDKEYCFLMKRPMYFYQPLDLETEEEEGTVKTDFVDWDVKNAYRQGFSWF